jgi:hypothetical protein
MRKIHAKDSVVWLEEGDISSEVGWGSGERLNIHMFGTEELLGTLNSQIFNSIDKFATAVVASARLTFGVFVGSDAAEGFENGWGDEVF